GWSGTDDGSCSAGVCSTGGCSRSQTRTFRATDACGNQSTATRTVTWTENSTGPVITPTGTTLTLGCNPDAATINAALGTATATEIGRASCRESASDSTVTRT